MTTLFHICPLADWQEAQRRGEYRTDSLTTEGFIHCSTAAQLIRTANRFYRGQHGLVVLVIDPAGITAEVRYEVADGNWFPHVYGSLPLDAVTEVFPLSPNADGTFDLPIALSEQFNTARDAGNVYFDRTLE